MPSPLKALLLYLVLAASLLAPDLGWTAPERPILVGSELSFPPYADVDAQGEPIGFSVDLFNAVARAVDIKVRYRTERWDKVWQGLQQGELDALPLVAKLKERAGLLEYTEAHTIGYDAFFVRRDTPHIDSVEAARPLSVIAMRSDAAADALLSRGFGGRLVLVSTLAEGLRLLAAGKHDALLAPLLQGNMLVHSLGLEELVEPGGPLREYRREFAFAVQRGDTALRDRLDQGLAIVKATGEYDRIYKKWLAAYEPARLPWKYVYWGGGAILSVLLLLAAWTWTLRRQVALRTGALAREVDRRRSAESELERHRDHLELLVASRTTELLLARQEAERAAGEARQGEARYRALFENMLDAYARHRMIFTDGAPADFVFLDVNPAFARLTRLEDVVGRPASEVMPGLCQSNPELFASFGRVAAGGPPERFETFVEPLGMWLSISTYSPAPGEFIAVFGDITERKASEAMLAGHGERQALLLEVAASILQTWGEDRDLARIVFDQVTGHLDADICFNYRVGGETGDMELVAAFGLPPDGEDSARRLALGQSYCGTVAAAAAPLAADREHIENDDRGAFLRSFGVRAYACHPLYSPAGSVIGTFSLASTRRDSFLQEEMDLVRTLAYLLSLAWERGRIERQLRQANADLERRVGERTAELMAANRELEAFTFATSHDLRGPLGRINSFGALLEKHYRERLEGDGLLFLDFIRQNSTRLMQLVDDLLNYARVTQQAQELRAVDLPAVTRGILQEQREEIGRVGAQVALSLPTVTVLGDHHALTQALGNLLQNALKYSATARPPVIDIGGKEVDGRCRLWVRDNGIGFDMAYHDKIFEMFRRLHTYSEYEGSGVGLALAKRAMERMGGRIWAESRPGEGATFFLEMQVA
ncbi:MAG TPA: transporter substrate-binding domain-containing protein [Rhodocyclaceae bacterium]|nr:transporter substrate-binding domain-containing protein [Rhodocyclaceae bacterium]